MINEQTYSILHLRLHTATRGITSEYKGASNSPVVDFSVFSAKDASVNIGSRVRREVWHDAPLLLTPLNSSLIDPENEHYYMKHGAVWMGTLRCPMSAPSEEKTYLRLPDFFRLHDNPFLPPLGPQVCVLSTSLPHLDLEAIIGFSIKTSSTV